MTMNSMQEKIKKLLEIDPRDHFTVNDSKFECHFLAIDRKPFTKWKKDENSPSLFCEAEVMVYDNADRSKLLEGLVLVQQNNSIENPLSAVLYIKPFGSEKWQTMHTIIDIAI